MSVKPIRRITLFKVPDEGDQEKLLAKYQTMPQDAVKVDFSDAIRRIRTN
jgi:hypothetical protein